MPPSQDAFVPAHLRRHSAMDDDELLGPTFEAAPLNRRMRARQDAILSHAFSLIEESNRQLEERNRFLEDNTAAGMAISQENSMYITPMSFHDTAEYGDTIQTEVKPDEGDVKHVHPYCEVDSGSACDGADARDTMHHFEEAGTSPVSSSPSSTIDAKSEVGGYSTRHTASMSPERTTPAQDEDLPFGLAKVDLGLERAGHTRAWDFTDKKPTMRSPSSLFQPYSKFVGTQQSDRQTYNVEVTILTVDMEQSSLSGYLLIRGLTPEYPMLQTFFTGEIVGGPNQKYSFKTMDPAWGANDKVDLQHWLRFPPWRHLTSYAKQDMSFEFPLHNEQWWTQEHIYMRWKEHFLVPDHRQSNISGASFEGFYYICLNQFEGKVSGVYFHSRSEKYQQLELTHVTKRGLGIFGVSPLVEIR